MNDLGWTVFAGAALREQLLYTADWFNSYSCSLDDNVYILIGLIISQDVIQEYLSRNHKGNCYRQMHSRSKHCHVTTSDQSEFSVMRASRPRHAFNRSGTGSMRTFLIRTYSGVWTNWVCSTASRPERIRMGQSQGRKNRSHWKSFMIVLN